MHLTYFVDDHSDSANGIIPYAGYLPRLYVAYKAFCDLAMYTFFLGLLSIISGFWLDSYILCWIAVSLMLFGLFILFMWMLYCMFITLRFAFSLSNKWEVVKAWVLRKQVIRYKPYDTASSFYAVGMYLETTLVVYWFTSS